jgi:hypothetical protein
VAIRVIRGRWRKDYPLISRIIADAKKSESPGLVIDWPYPLAQIRGYSRYSWSVAQGLSTNLANNREREKTVKARVVIDWLYPLTQIRGYSRYSWSVAQGLSTNLANNRER